MSAVHEQLYLSDQIGRIDVGEYLRKLVDNLAETYGRKAAITYDLDDIGAVIELALEPRDESGDRRGHRSTAAQ